VHENIFAFGKADGKAGLHPSAVTTSPVASVSGSIAACVASNRKPARMPQMRQPQPRLSCGHVSAFLLPRLQGQRYDRF